ncbi:MAG TPA: hypothetical protein VF469_28400 [Kofleriaceae bacterium]
MKTHRIARIDIYRADDRNHRFGQTKPRRLTEDDYIVDLGDIDENMERHDMLAAWRAGGWLDEAGISRPPPEYVGCVVIE